MNKEEKELLLKDLCARLPYGVKVHVKFYGDYSDSIERHDFILTMVDTKYPNNCYWIGGEQLQESGKFEYGTTDFAIDIDDEDQDIKPYLRSLSSMTEKEKEEVFQLIGNDIQRIDFYLAHHIDFKGLIRKGLALEAPEDMYKF